MSILIVEDEGITALNIKNLLENWGYENPLIVLSIKNIFQEVAEYKPDLILMDINLNEDIDGIEIAKQLQTDFDIPVIYLTAHSDEVLVERAKLTEHYGYIIKPFNDEELRITIDHALYKHKMEMELKKANKHLQIELEKKESIEKELKNSEEKFRGIVEQSYDGIALIGENGSIIEWNHGMEKITGVKEEHILGKTIWDMPDELYLKEKSHELYNHFEKDVMGFVGSKNSSLSGKLFEGTVTNVDGSIKAVQIRHFPIKTNNKRIVAGIAHDITEQKKMEDELKTAKTNLELKIKERTRELIKSNEELKKEIIERKNAEKALTKSRNFLDKIINSIADPVFVKDKRHRWILLNDAFCKLMGYPREELLGKSDYNFLSAHEASIFWDKDEEVFKTGIENVNEEEVTDSEGNVHTLVTKKTLYSDNSGEKYLVAVIRDITELKDAENTIKKSESYYKTIFENTGAATFIVEEDTTISLVNAEFEKICGYSKEEIEGIKSWKEFVAPEYLKKMEEYHNFRRINLDRAPKKYEFKFVDRYGNIKNVLTTMDIISGTKKSLASLLDITDKKTAIDALRESEARLKIAMDMAKLVHWEYDVDLDLYTFDNQFYRLYGTTVDREGGSQMSSKEYAKRFLPPEESHMVMEGIAETLETDDPNFSKKSEHSIIRADGEKRFILVRCEIVKDAEGRTIKTYGVNQDITELKMAEKEIEENLKKLDVLNRVIVTANSSDNLQSLLKDILNLVLEFMNFEVGAIYLIDEKEGMAKLEHFTEDVNSFSIDNIKIDDYPFSKVYIEGLSLFVDDFDEIPPENLKPSNFESLAVVPIYSKEKIIGSFNILSRNKHYFTQKEKDIINSIGGEIGSTISKLVTEEKMKKLITELKRSNDELRQFAYITSHDLQEPLRTIASFTQLLERRYKNKLDSDADEFIDYIVEASIRMKQMILDLLEYSRLTRVEKKCEPLKIEDMLLNIFDNLNLLIMENKAQITYENLPTVFADESQLFRVFQNLIENAIKFKKENEDPQIHISTYFDEKNKEHVFSVSDNGIGIEEQYFNRIFTLFQRLHTREEYEGTGIGLSISKRIIENHGGKMWVESEYGNGATFYFTIKNKS
ncbi:MULTISPECIES: PAS domain S-box protein [Methanobacterium]|uniref:histidine kinase n=1 Tax=Methanobacterium veterum TaxID=408577 RepID=A0A9E5A4K1_9EURY|nr:MULTISPECIES: PAS domain S-box protein [Methanobacterium]MCZ3364707.1 PAS domain S-box protein [Methanobacterium veterum]MCZ3372461.1 PAS domain S-box protein [Methanobacterium veterum]